MAISAAYLPPATASWMPWRAERNAVGLRSLGSAVSAEVSEQVCRQSTPRSPTTSLTAKEPDEASASMMISQPSVLTRSRVTRAASSGWPLESRTTSSTSRPPKPPDALNWLTASVAASRLDVPRMATRPDRMVGMPMRSLAPAPRATKGAPSAETATPAPAATSSWRRDGVSDDFATDGFGALLRVMRSFPP